MHNVILLHIFYPKKNDKRTCYLMVLNCYINVILLYILFKKCSKKLFCLIRNWLRSLLTFCMCYILFLVVTFEN